MTASSANRPGGSTLRRVRPFWRPLGFWWQRRITTAGAGKVQKDVPDGDQCQLVFGDGASLTMWQVDIPEKNAANSTGTFIRYADADGRIYQYDTDQLLFTEIAAILALP